MTNFVQHIEKCLNLSDNYNSKLSSEILNIDGMSGKKTRHFYNNLCSIENARYLEIGTWKGSSICSAMYNNKMACLAIDNWSETIPPLEKFHFSSSNSAKNDFLENFNKFKGENNATFIEANCWDIDVSKLGKFNIYMYDGNHTETSHFQALNHYLPCLDDKFIYIIDDWNWESVRNGTISSIKKNNCKILYKKEIFTNNNKHPSWGPGLGDRAGKNGDWHNGICIFVLTKYQSQQSFIGKKGIIFFFRNFRGIGYRLSYNWFPIIPIEDFENKPVKYLEIGAFYGFNMISVAETYCLHPESKLYCIDPWLDYQDYYEYKGQQDNTYNHFLNNIEKSGIKDKTIIKRGFSNEEIVKFEDNFFDIIYIDGSHEPEYVLEDAVLSFRKLKVGGIMIFDDYGWGGPDLTQRGIDGFLSGYHKKIELINLNHNSQTFIKKIKGHSSNNSTPVKLSRGIL